MLAKQKSRIKYFSTNDYISHLHLRLHSVWRSQCIDSQAFWLKTATHAAVVFNVGYGFLPHYHVDSCLSVVSVHVLLLLPFSSCLRTKRLIDRRNCRSIASQHLQLVDRQPVGGLATDGQSTAVDWLTAWGSVGCWLIIHIHLRIRIVEGSFEW